MSTIAERVAAGVKFLDEHDPDWWRADIEHPVNLWELSLSNPRRCILGQRCPREKRGDNFDSPYVEMARSLSGIPAGSEDLLPWAAALGFEASLTSIGVSVTEYETLTAEWKRVIAERRAA